MKEKVLKALEKVRPHLQADGGDVELVEVTADGVVKLRLKGACGCCPMAAMTMQQGISQVLKKEVPEIKKIESV